MADPVAVRRRIEEIVTALIDAAEATGEPSVGVILAAIALVLARVAVVSDTPLEMVLSAVEVHYRQNEACRRAAQQIEQARAQKPAGGCVN